jgi:ribonuclease HII
MPNLNHEKTAWGRGFSLVAGVDEAGRGPLAGPVVASAVILKGSGFKERIDDSKALTARQRQAAYEEIRKKAVIGIGAIDNNTIDRLNIAVATAMAMKQALFNLMVRPDFILIDGNMDIGTKIPCKYIISGDSKSLSIAAASIVAKVTRDNIMFGYHRQYPTYDFAKHKGYGTKRHIWLMKKLGPCQIHRRSFRVD